MYSNNNNNSNNSDSRLRLALRAQLVHRNALASAVLRVVWTHAGDNQDDEDEDDIDDNDDDDDEVVHEYNAQDEDVRKDDDDDDADYDNGEWSKICRASFLSLQSEKRPLRDYARAEFRASVGDNGVVGGGGVGGGGNISGGVGSGGVGGNGGVIGKEFDPLEYENKKLEVVHRFYQRLQVRVGHQCLRGQIVLVYNKIRRVSSTLHSE